MTNFGSFARGDKVWFQGPAEKCSRSWTGTMLDFSICDGSGRASDQLWFQIQHDWHDFGSQPRTMRQTMVPGLSPGGSRTDPGQRNGVQFVRRPCFARPKVEVPWGMLSFWPAQTRSAACTLCKALLPFCTMRQTMVPAPERPPTGTIPPALCDQLRFHDAVGSCGRQENKTRVECSICDQAARGGDKL